MNRLLDYRTDFYSLGVTFYELLTGYLPFPTVDMLELVHCHIAKQPVPPHEINTTIPKPVSDIILKLMAKNAEDRYQSAWGIKADLEICAEQLAQIGQISSIQLAETYQVYVAVTDQPYPTEVSRIGATRFEDWLNHSIAPREVIPIRLNIRCENQDLGVVKAKKFLYLNL
ncbi:MAG: hypothetical protein V7K87_33645 [Nostoc sp.]